LPPVSTQIFKRNKNISTNAQLSAKSKSKTAEIREHELYDTRTRAHKYTHSKLEFLKHMNLSTFLEKKCATAEASLYNCYFHQRFAYPMISSLGLGVGSKTPLPVLSTIN